MMQQMSMKWYVICSLLVYFVAGMHYYIFDRSVMSKLFAWWDRWTGDPEKPRPARGLIFGRSTGSQAMWAAIITFATSIWLWMHGSNLMVEIWTSIFDTTMVLLGFLVGPFAYRLWGGRNKVIEVADRIQQKAQAGELGNDIADAAKDLSDDVREKVSGLSSAATGAAKDVLDTVTDRVVGKRPFGTPEAKTPAAPVIQTKKTTLTEAELRERQEKDRKGLGDYIRGK